MLLDRVVGPPVCVLHPVRKRSLRGQLDPIFYQLRTREEARPPEQAHGLPDRHHVLAFGVVDCEGQIDRRALQKAMVREAKTYHSAAYGIEFVSALGVEQDLPCLKYIVGSLRRRLERQTLDQMVLTSARENCFHIY